MARSDHSDRDKAERIKRLKERLDLVRADHEQLRPLVSILKGVLDLLADEL